MPHKAKEVWEDKIHVVQTLRSLKLSILRYVNM